MVAAPLVRGAGCSDLFVDWGIAVSNSMAEDAAMWQDERNLNPALLAESRNLRRKEPNACHLLKNELADAYERSLASTHEFQAREYKETEKRSGE